MLLITLFAGIDILCGLTIWAANSQIGYKRSKGQAYIMRVLYKKDELFHNRLKVWKGEQQSRKKEISMIHNVFKTNLNES